MSYQQVTQSDNKDDVLPGFLQWIGLADALEIDENELPRLYPNEATQLIFGGKTLQPRCYDICPLAQQLQDQVRDATAERAQSRIFCLERQLQEKPGHRDAKETMTLVKGLFDIADRSQASNTLTRHQKELVKEIRTIHTKSIAKLLMQYK